MLTSLDAHTVDLHTFKYGGTNFTAFRMIDTNKMEVKSVIRDIVSKEITQGRTLDIQDGNLDTTTALIYDAVHLFALGGIHKPCGLWGPEKFEKVEKFGKKKLRINKENSKNSKKFGKF